MKIKEIIRTLLLLCVAMAGMIQFSGCAKKTDLQSIIAVDESVTRSCLLFSKNSYRHFKSLQRDYAITPMKAKTEYDKAVTLLTATDTIIKFINDLKYSIISEADGRCYEKIAELDMAAFKSGKSILPILKRIENTQVPEKMLFYGDSCNLDKLSYKLEKYKNQIVDLLGPKHSRRILIGLEINKKDYRNQPVAAVVLLLNSVLMEVMNTESETIALLNQLVYEERYDFSNVRAVVVPDKERVKEGEKFEAEIFIAAYDTTFNHRIKVGSGIDYETLEIAGPVQNLKMENGICKCSVTAHGKGKKTIAGSFEVLSINGTITRYPFEYSYYVE